MKKLTTIFISLFLLLQVITPTKVNASGTTISYTVNITNVTQAKSNWCWAACAEMVGKSITSSGRNQWQVVNHFYGTTSNQYPNIGASGVAEVASAAMYAALNQKAFDSTENIWSFNQINSSIQNHRAVIPLWTYTKTDGTFVNKHSLVIFKTETYIDDFSGAHYVYVYYVNPSTGASTKVSYTNFSHKTIVKNGITYNVDYTDTAYIRYIT